MACAGVVSWKKVSFGPDPADVGHPTFWQVRAPGMRQAHWSYEADFVAEAASVAAARQFVRGHLSHHGLSYLVEDVRLVVSELATNAMVHAQTPFTVTLAEGDRSVLLTVRDGSPESPVQAAASVLDTRGRGISIVAQISSDWGVNAAVDASHAKSVWALFDTTHRLVAAPTG